MNLISGFALSLPSLLFLADVAITSAVVCGAALLIVQQWRSMSLPLRHTALVGALIVALVGPLVIGLMTESGFSLIHLRLYRDNVSLGRDMDRLPPPPSRVEFSPALAQRDVAGNSAFLGGTPPPTDAVAKSATGSQVRLSDAARSGQSLLRLTGSILAAGWAAGCIVCLWRLGVGFRQLRRLLRSLSPLVDRRLSELAIEAARELGLATVPPLCQSDLICTPVSVGLFRPRIVMPVGMLSSFTEKQLGSLLLHELSHVVRGDLYIGLLQRLATTIYWWNPPVRRVSVQVSALREQICDDLASRGDSAHSYAEMLVDLAGRTINLRPLPATIGIFDSSANEFSERVRRLLDPRKTIVTMLDRRMKAVGGGLFLVLLCLAAAAPIQVQPAGAAVPTAAPDTTTPNSEPPVAIDPPLAADKSDDGKNSTAGDAAPAVKWPSVLRGMIQDVDGKPIAGAHVRFDFEKIHEYNIGRWDELLDSQSLVTGEDGVYRIDASKLPNLMHRPFAVMLTCTAEGYADTKWWNWYSHDDVKVDEMLTNIKMPPGRIVHGRCVDREGNPLPGAIVKMASDFDFKSQGPSSWAWDPRETNDDGEFQFSIPRDTDKAFEVLAVHPQWAPQWAAVPKSGDELADIRLREGSPLSGKVLKEDGSPVAGAVVVAESVDDGTLKTVTFASRVATRTDASGNYRVQPLFGLYKVFLSQAEKTDNRLEHPFVVADEPPPLVVPVRVALSRHEAQTVDFHAGPTLTVRGTMKWPDGRPVARSRVQASYMPPGNGTGIWLGQTSTDADGKYSLTIPKPIADIGITAIGAFDEHRKWFTAVPDEKVQADSKNEQHIGFKKLDKDIGDIDWVLRSSD
jgi:beta-lactamase regulating signal transducer with metallopeptidase domain